MTENSENIVQFIEENHQIVEADFSYWTGYVLTNLGAKKLLATNFENLIAVDEYLPIMSEISI